MSTDIAQYETQTITFVQANNVTPANTTGGFASAMTITLPVPIDLSNAEVALASFYCYYSWFNVTAALQNNTLSYTLPNSTGSSWPSGNLYPVFTNSANPNVIGNGLYAISDLNNVLAYTLQYNGHYYIDNNGNNVYPISIAVNPTGYNVTVTLTALYSSLPTGWAYGTSITGTTPFNGMFFTKSVAQLNFPVTGNPAGTYLAGQSSMSKLLGFTAGNYPPTGTVPSTVTAAQYQYTSQYPPQIGVINSVNVCCNLVNASAITPIASSVIYNFSPTVQSGQQVQEKPQQQLWLPVTAGKYNQIAISLQTDTFTQLPVVDPAMSCTILVRRRVLPTRKQTLIQQAIAPGTSTGQFTNSKRPREDGSSIGGGFAQPRYSSYDHSTE